MEEKELLRRAGEMGFDRCGIVDQEALTFRPGYRVYCEMNYCGNYGNNYACPPACGTPEEMEARTKKYRRALVLQTVTPVKDIMDDEETRVIKQRHNRMTWELIEKVSPELGDYLPAMAGPCGFCSPCKKTLDKPCPYPEKRASCLSAYCVQVDALAELCQMPYYCQGEVAFFSLLFFSCRSAGGDL